MDGWIRRAKLESNDVPPVVHLVRLYPRERRTAKDNEYVTSRYVSMELLAFGQYRSSARCRRCSMASNLTHSLLRQHLAFISCLPLLTS
jgi:hypothetical protein